MIRTVALALALVVVAVGVAAAQPQVTLTPRPVVDPKRKNAAPDIEATVIAGPNVPLDQFTLTQSDAKVPVTLKASSIKKYTEGSEAISVVLLIEGHEVWLGNESYEEVEDDKYPGVFSKLPPVFEPMSRIGPPGSQGALLVYGQGVETKAPLGPIEQLTVDKMGSQRDYEGKISRDLVNGVTSAIAMLKGASTARKAIIYVGDGSDTNPDQARESLVSLRKSAEAEGIELHGVQYFAEGLENSTAVVKALIPGVIVAQSMENIGASVDAIATRISDRYYLTFPGYDPQLKAGFLWDGQPHEMVLKIGDDELEPVTLTMLPKWQVPSKGKGFPWLAVIIPVGGILALVVLVKLLGRKAPAPPPPVAMPVMEAAPAAKPAGPMKTVMIGAGGDADGFPVVGWLVPLNGPQQHQTFRLQQGVTKIGTGGAVQIVVDDGFMSTEHFQIAGSPHGFVLTDNKSTNGTYVNENKVDKQELVDNDIITVGKTNLVFKSIN